MVLVPAKEALKAAHFPNRQERYRAEYRLRKPGWQDSLSLYIQLIERVVGPETWVLDIGCGHADFLGAVYARTPHIYGLDPDAEALARNTIIRHKVVGRAEALPFADRTFDLVTCAWVLEHLERPEPVFREISRVLKPGGRFIFLTPNVWNYNVWLIRSVPHRFHAQLTQKLYGRQRQDTYRVYYRINSPGRLERLARAVGLEREQLLLNGDPSYISFNRLLFAFACILEKVLDWKPLRGARVHIIGSYRKL
uniref:SAM-dependent methyltransferase n=1 Tax=Thermogemmatispora argillosa TaxID=2045280 RepID=A0A455SZC1_9CHLR|nr:SAM-dependent methyltransferase [Thermogemmatispora argillosa]